jgi:hypothetical protein
MVPDMPAGDRIESTCSKLRLDHEKVPDRRNGAP